MSYEWHPFTDARWYLGDDGDQFTLADVYRRDSCGVHEWDGGTVWEWFILGKWYARSFVATPDEAKAAAEKALREVAERILREVPE